MIPHEKKSYPDKIQANGYVDTKFIYLMLVLQVILNNTEPLGLIKSGEFFNQLVNIGLS